MGTGHWGPLVTCEAPSASCSGGLLHRAWIGFLAHETDVSSSLEISVRPSGYKASVSLVEADVFLCRTGNHNEETPHLKSHGRSWSSARSLALGAFSLQVLQNSPSLCHRDSARPQATAWSSTCGASARGSLGLGSVEGTGHWRSGTGS